MPRFVNGGPNLPSQLAAARRLCHVWGRRMRGITDRFVDSEPALRSTVDAARRLCHFLETQQRGFPFRNMRATCYRHIAYGVEPAASSSVETGFCVR